MLKGLTKIDSLSLLSLWAEKGSAMIRVETISTAIYLLYPHDALL